MNDRVSIWLRLRLGRLAPLSALLALAALPSGLLAGTLIFSDGFETGDTSQWPPPGVPFITTSAGTTLVLEGTGPQAVDGALTVSDSDSANLIAASVTILDPADGASEGLDGPGCAGLVVTPGPGSL
ncbi:MAG: Cadherin 4 protein, partial [Acidobacteriota bacterium]|nr:Cadherin 4 protein [Acidobacteriota bacterium]